MRDGKTFWVIKLQHILMEQLSIQSTLNLCSKTIFYGDSDRIAHIFLGRNQNITFINNDSAACFAFIWPSQDKATWPMVPTALLINETILADGRVFANGAI